MLARLETRYSSRRTFETYTYNGNYPLASAQVGRFKKRAIGEAMDDLRYFDVAILTVFVSKRGLRQNAANRDSFICNVKTIFQAWRLIQAKHSSLESVDAPEGGSVWEAAGQAYGCMAAFLFTGVGTSGTVPWFAWTAFHCARGRFERLSVLPPCKGRGRFCYSCWSRLLSSAENAV